MGVREARRGQTIRRVWESVAASVASGLILWSVTGSMSRSGPATDRTATSAASGTLETIVPNSSEEPASLANGVASAAPNAGVPSIAPSVISPPPSGGWPVPVAVPGPAPPMPPQKRSLVPYAPPVGTVLMFENFAAYHDGDAAGWGPNTLVKTGLDHRNWLASNVLGIHPVGCRIQLPSAFSLECRYSADMPELTRGILGWWKEPVATKLSFTDQQGTKYVIDWVIRCGNDPTKLNPLGSSSLCVRKQYHTIRLPEGTSTEVGVVQPTGVLRIDRDKSAVKVYVDGQLAAVGTMGSPTSQIAGFEIDVVKAKNGALFFTDFKVSR
ncbi:MAG: hypothetical protein ABFC63_07555 [Thermoguttaceae bacterium]